MACKDCGPAPSALSTTDRLTFDGPLDGVRITVTADGTLSHKNLSFVRDFLSFTYDQMAAHAAAEEATDG